MKNFLQNLLVLFALALCVLVAIQWNRETKLRQDIQQLTGNLHEQQVTLQGLQGTLKAAEAEVVRLDGLKKQIDAATQTRLAKMARLEEDQQKSRAEIERLTQQGVVYKAALATANANITTQNEAMKKLTGDHNEVVAKFNQLASDYNDLAAKWNTLQTQLGRDANTPVLPKQQ